MLITLEKMGKLGNARLSYFLSRSFQVQQSHGRPQGERPAAVFVGVLDAHGSPAFGQGLLLLFDEPDMMRNVARNPFHQFFKRERPITGMTACPLEILRL
jgi:hypothetical protein